MIKTIELTKSNVARLGDTEPFLLPDKLIFEFKSIGYDISNAFISMQNGEKKVQYKLTNPFYLPPEVLFAGNLNIAIHCYKDGEKIKSWYCLPIKIIETKHGVFAFDVLHEIEKRIQLLEENSATKEQYNLLANAHNELVKNHNELTETVSEIKEKIKEI